MSNRSRNYEEGNDDMNMEDDMIEDNRPGKCARFLSYTWRFCTCVFSHTVLVSMVVSYCVLGAFTFEALEKEYEKSVKRNITWIRGNLTNEIWSLVQSSLILHEEVWTHNVTTYLEAFEGDLLFAMKKNGWDGDDDVEQLQWTFAGALFYSIIVITTIGYGHIAPKTHWGKVVTIFYAILGIPLMLLCLSNIGDVMATSFRFLYWRVCCYVCTKKPRKHRSRRLRPGRPTLRQQTSRFSGRSRTASFKRSGRTSQRSADSGFGLSEITPSSYSDTECRYNGDASTSAAPEPLQRHLRPSQMSHNSDTAATTSTRTGNATPTRVSNIRGGSLDRRRQARGTTAMDSANDAPVLCNRYAVDRELRQNPIPERRDAKTEEPKEDEPAPARRSQSVPRQQNFLEPPPCTSVAVYDEQPVKKKDRKRPVQHHPPTARIMSPMGFAVHRQHNLTVYDDESDDNDMDDAYSDAYYSGSGEGRRVDRTKPVPIWLCVFLVVSYIIAGAFLFKSWEEWAFLDSAYFCFITLTTIGFGDFVPANRVGSNNSVSIALCSLYLLFGIALLAMSFNLVQEEVIANVRSVAKKLGIIKEEERDEDDDDD